jgi:hypothetical protein
MALLAMWLAQDLLQVLAMEVVLVPEMFLLAVAYKVVTGSPSPERISLMIWLAFAGGILWELRWVTFPGISGLVNTAAALVIHTVWNRTPSAGRGVLLFGLLAGAAHFLSGAVHYAAWSIPGQAAARMFLIQQLLGIPALALMCVILAFRESDVRV